MQQIINSAYQQLTEANREKKQKLEEARLKIRDLVQSELVHLLSSLQPNERKHLVTKNQAFFTIFEEKKQR